MDSLSLETQTGLVISVINRSQVFPGCPHPHIRVVSIGLSLAINEKYLPHTLKLPAEDRLVGQELIS